MIGGYISCVSNYWQPLNPGERYNDLEARGLNKLGICYDGNGTDRYNIDGHFAWVPSNARRNMPDWLDPDSPLLSKFLKSVGYATAHFGKWHLANDMIPDSPLPSQYGFDAYGAFNCSGKQMPVHEDAINTISFMKKSKKEGKTGSKIDAFVWRALAAAEITNVRVLRSLEWKFRIRRAEPIWAHKGPYGPEK